MSRTVRRVLRVGFWLLIGGPLSLLLLAGLTYGAYGLWARGSVDEAHVAYLRQHQESALTPDALQFTVFDSAFYRNQLFLLGEAHGCAVPQQLDFALLRHLNARAGVRHYAAELDAGQAHSFNEYLRTGDEANLDAVFDFWSGTAQWGNEEFFAKLRRIRALNQTLPAARRIQFLGLDRVQQVGLSGRYLREVLAGAGYQPGAAPALDSLQAHLRARTDEADDLLPLVALARRAARTLPALPGPAAQPVAALLRNLGYLAPRVRRDSVMVLNLAAAYADGQLTPATKLYGLWGLAHVLQDEFNHVQTLGGLVRRADVPCRRGVVSLVTFLLDSKMMMPAMAAPPFLRPAGRLSVDVPMSQDGPLVFAPGVRDLAAISQPSTVTLFRLDAPASPYAHSQRLAAARAPAFGQTMLPTKPGAATTDYFQYAVLVRNSAAVRPRPANGAASRAAAR